MAKIQPVLLSGGAGTRLWPLSRTLLPKQLLPLVSTNSLLQDTALRVRDERRFEPPLVVCNAEHRFVIAEQLRALGIAPRGILLEPVGRNTAPAVAATALWLGADDALLLVLPSDHAIPGRESFLRAVDRAAEAARAGAIVTFGVKALRAETGYGYIEGGAALGGAAGARRVRRFIEKPDAARA
ncbi:MAG: sugar phosphate nucleotidyltransferase, partial [Alphaproteobacteria bacterium]